MARGRIADHIADVEHLVGVIRPDDIAARLGYASPRNLRRVLRRAGRQDLSDALAPDHPTSERLIARRRSATDEP